jgi:SanA protein
MKNRRQLPLILIMLVLPLLVIALANVIILASTYELVYNDVAEIPSGGIGLVPGCPPTVTNGTPNTYFVQRINAASKLMKAGKIQLLVLSGASDGGSYDEPAAMKAALIKRGIPATQLRLDYRGKRTLASLNSVNQDYHGQAIVIITQQAHARRALYLARHLDIDAVAYNAQTEGFNDTLMLTVRESLARVRAIVDVYWLQNS